MLLLFRFNAFFFSVSVDICSPLLLDVCSLLVSSITATFLYSLMVSYWTDTTHPRSKISDLFKRLIPRPVMPVSEKVVYVPMDAFSAEEEIKDVYGEEERSDS